MSNFNDIRETAYQDGFLLDSCGSEERYYDWGLFTDLCGMSVKDAMEAMKNSCNCNGNGGSSSGSGGSGSETTKKNNVLYLTLEEVAA